MLASCSLHESQTQGFLGDSNNGPGSENPAFVPFSKQAVFYTGENRVGDRQLWLPWALPMARSRLFPETQAASTESFRNTNNFPQQILLDESAKMGIFISCKISKHRFLDPYDLNALLPLQDTGSWNLICKLEPLSCQEKLWITALESQRPCFISVGFSRVSKCLWSTAGTPHMSWPRPTRVMGYNL